MTSLALRGPVRLASGAAAMLLLTVAGCRRDDADRVADSAAGVLPADTAPVTSTLTPAAPAPPPTARDADVVRDALEFKLTDENVAKFVQAGNRLAFLRARDSQVRGYLESMGGSRPRDEEAALQRLERHAQINQAITDAGLSARDYYTMAIAIASARRFIDNPDAAPPTPTLRENAQFLRERPQYVAQLRVWGQ